MTLLQGPWPGSVEIEVSLDLPPPPQMTQHSCGVTVFELMDDGSVVCPRCDVTLELTRWHEIKAD